MLMADVVPRDHHKIAVISEDANVRVIRSEYNK